jgi:hypothetical protein
MCRYPRLLIYQLSDALVKHWIEVSTDTSKVLEYAQLIRYLDLFDLLPEGLKKLPIT